MGQESQYSAFQAAKMVALCGAPAILSSESLECYKKLLAGLAEDFRPKTYLERVLIRNFVDESWNIFRVQRFKASVLERRVDEIRKLQSERDKAQAQKEASAQGRVEEIVKGQTERERADEMEDIIFNSIADVDNILATRPEDLEYARAFELSIKTYQELDLMETRAIRRRDAILRQLEHCKEGWGGHLHKVWMRDQVEYQEATRAADEKLKQQRNQEAAPNASFPEAAE